MLAACVPRDRRDRRGRRRTLGIGPAASSIGVGDPAGLGTAADRRM
jgi:hypothetical protein